MNILREKKGITLIALIVTIIVMLILVGVTIVSLTGEGGIIGKANSAQIKNITAGYIEEINFEVTNEKIDRTGKEKEEAFIISIKNRLEGKSWVKQITASDESFVTNIPDEDKKLLLVNTKEDYVILISVDNERLIANINGATDKYETYTITYVANNGTSETSTQEVIKGISTKVKENTYEKAYNSFVGWCEDENGEGTRYISGSNIPFDSDKTLYAIWTKDRVALRFDANAGTGTMSEIEVGTNSTIAYPELNGITRTGANFLGWNTAADGSGTNYAEAQKETIQIQIEEEDITLYAQWEMIPYSIAYNLDNGTATNPTSYNAETETFTLSRPVREGYTFLGWTGTGLESATKAVTIEKGSEGNRSYTATWYQGYMAYTLGQEVTIGDEQFFVIEASDANQNTVTALTKYNVNSAGTAQTNISRGYYGIFFTTPRNKFWSGEVDDLNSYVDSPYAIAIKVAKNYGLNKGGTGRLMIKSEAENLRSSIGNILAGRSYSTGPTTNGFLLWWLASSKDSSKIWTVWGYNGTGTDMLYANWGDSDSLDWWTPGVRPVITVPKYLVS